MADSENDSPIETLSHCELIKLIEKKNKNEQALRDQLKDAHVQLDQVRNALSSTHLQLDHVLNPKEITDRSIELTHRRSASQLVTVGIDNTSSPSSVITATTSSTKLPNSQMNDSMYKRSILDAIGSVAMGCFMSLFDKLKLWQRSIIVVFVFVLIDILWPGASSLVTLFSTVRIWLTSAISTRRIPPADSPSPSPSPSLSSSTQSSSSQSPPSLFATHQE